MIPISRPQYKIVGPYPSGMAVEYFTLQRDAKEALAKRYSGQYEIEKLTPEEQKEYFIASSWAREARREVMERKRAAERRAANEAWKQYKAAREKEERERRKFPTAKELNQELARRLEKQRRELAEKAEKARAERERRDQEILKQRSGFWYHASVVAIITPLILYTLGFFVITWPRSPFKNMWYAFIYVAPFTILIGLGIISVLFNSLLAIGIAIYNFIQWLRGKEGIENIV